MFNVYSSPFIPWLGRFIVITTIIKDVSETITSEVFIFAADAAPPDTHFHGHSLSARPEIQSATGLDSNKLEKDVLEYARCKINQYQLKKCEENKDTSLYNFDFELNPIDKTSLIRLKDRNHYTKELNELLSFTKCDELKKYLTLLLSFTIDTRYIPE